MAQVRALALSSIASLATACALAAVPAQARQAGDVIPDSYICTFKPGPINVGAEARSAAAPFGGRVTFVYHTGFNGFAIHIAAPAAASMVVHNPLIDNCIRDHVATVPEGEAAAMPAVGRPGGGGGSGQTTAWGVKRVGGPGDGTGTRAWVIDSGIQLNHPDLNVDTLRSHCFLGGTCSADDAFGHGTHVAGIIGALNNGYGVVGVAAGASLVSLRVLDATGNGADSGVIAAIDWVCNNTDNRGVPGDVINLSLITGPLAPMDQAVEACGAKGIMVAIAAGNSSANANNYSPARANGPNVFTVSATDSKDIYARYSNWGNPPIDFAEPGSSILSTYIGSSYATLSGTSMAAPHIAGILLLHAKGGGALAPNSGGLAQRDPDGNPDTIGVK